MCQCLIDRGAKGQSVKADISKNLLRQDKHYSVYYIQYPQKQLSNQKTVMTGVIFHQSSDEFAQEIAII